MLNRDRYLIVPEQEFDGKTSEHFLLSDFPFPEELVEIFPGTWFLDNMKLQPQECFYNALRWAKMSYDYPEMSKCDVVFCYISSGDLFTPHAIIEQDGEYSEVTPGVDPMKTKYYRYASISYEAYMAEMRDQLGVDFDPMDRKFNPLTANKDGLFVFVNNMAFNGHTDGFQNHPEQKTKDERVGHRSNLAHVATNILNRFIKFISSRRRQ